MRTKTLLPLLTLCCLLPLAMSAAGTNDVQVKLAWDYSPAVETLPEGGQVTNAPTHFVLHSSTSASIPRSQWPAVKVIEAFTNGVFVTDTMAGPFEPGRRFFFLTASNAFGESLPSNTALRWEAPQSGHLRIVLP